MKHFIYIPLLLLLLSACGSSKKTTTTVHTVKDSTVQKAEQHTAASEQSITHTTEKDSAIGISAKSVKGYLDSNDLKPARTTSGKAIGQQHETKKDGVRAYVNVDSIGRITYGCDVDSYTLVIKGLIRESAWKQYRYDSLAFAYEHKTRIEYSEIEKFVRKVRGAWWLPYVLIVIGCIAFVFLAEWVLKKYF